MDLGGVKRHFFTSVMREITTTSRIALFETTSGHHLLHTSQEAYLSKSFEMLGKMVIHSVLNEGPGLPISQKQYIPT